MTREPIIREPMFREPLRRRKPLRLKHYDYAQAGAYFVTVGVQHRTPLFGEVLESKMHLNEAGKMVTEIWQGLPSRFPTIMLDAFVVMPNHVHGIVVLGDYKNRPYEVEGNTDRRGEPCVRPVADRPQYPQASTANQGRPQGTADGSLGRIIQAFKSMTTHTYINGVRKQNWTPFDERLWQRNYYERIIRSEEELNQIRRYIETNPLRWHLGKGQIKGDHTGSPPTR